jgi:hypothetical protein
MLISTIYISHNLGAIDVPYSFETANLKRCVVPTVQYSVKSKVLTPYTNEPFIIGELPLYQIYSPATGTLSSTQIYST